jgi:hypothetical protein
MAQTYLLFDFGADETKVQQARHKLDSWRQAFRLDKKLQFKFDRGVNATSEVAEGEPATAEKGKAEKSKADKTKGKTKAKSSETASQTNGNVKLIVRLYFSGHEKLSEQRWVARIPSEEPFKGASPKVVAEDTPEFAEILQRFDTLD